MPHYPENADYETLTRPRTLEPEPEDNSMGAPLRPRSGSRAGVPGNEQVWPARSSTSEEGFTWEQTSEKPKEHQPVRLKDNWIIKRGHAVSYAGLFLFTVVLYFRPYELFPSLSGFSSIAWWTAIFTILVFVPTQLAIEGTLTTRPREVNLLLLLCLAALLSMPLAIDPAESWRSFSDGFVKYFLIFIIMVNVVRTEWRLSGLLLLALAVSCALSVNALNDYRLGNLTVEGYRVQGFLAGLLENPNDLGIFLVTMMPIAFGLSLGTRGVVRRIVYGACAIVIVAASVVTFSRGAFIGTVAVILVLAWKLGRRNRIAVMAAAVVGIALFLMLAPGNYWLRLASIFDSSLDLRGSSGARSDLLKHSLKVALRHPLLGIGMSNYQFVSSRAHVSHNAYTQVAAEMGMFALAVYVMFIVMPLKRLRQIENETSKSKRSSRFYYVAIGLQASLVGYMVSSFFASVAFYWFIYYLVGYAICFRRIYETKSTSEERLVRDLQQADERALSPRLSFQGPPVSEER